MTAVSVADTVVTDMHVLRNTELELAEIDDTKEPV